MILPLPILPEPTGEAYQRNGKPTPWSGLVGSASSRSGGSADLAAGVSCAGGCRDATDDPESRFIGEYDSSGAIPVRVDGNHYYYALGPGVFTPLVQQIGPFFYRYDGQQLFAVCDKSALTGVWGQDEIAGSIQRDPDADSLLGVGRDVAVDELGRRWVLFAVDEHLLTRQTKRYESLVQEQFGRQAGKPRQPSAQRVGEVPAASDGSDFYVVDSRTINSCGYLVNSDYPMRNVDKPFGERSRKVVSVRVDNDASRGSGTMIDDRHILTAAHVVTDGSGNHKDVKKMFVCTYGNCTSNASSSRQYELACYTVGWNHPRDQWKGTGNGLTWQDWDYAIITLTSVLEGKYTFGWMAIDSDEWYIGKVSDRHLGYPAQDESCNSNSSCTSAVVSSFLTRDMFFAKGEAIGVWTGRVDFSTSTGSGFSGGPHYNCPTEDCDDGHYISAVHSGHTTTGTPYSYGPKATSFYSWANGFTFNYL